MEFNYFRYRFRIILLTFFLISIQVISFSQVAKLKEDYRKATTDRDRVMTLGELAVEYCNINVDSALLFADSLADFCFQSKNDHFISKAYAVLGYVYERKGNYDLALKNELLALKYSEKTGEELLIANNLNGVGVMYDFLGDYEKALNYYFKGYEIRKRLNDQEGMQQSLSNIGLVYHLKGDFKNALEYLYKSRDIAESMKDTPGYTSALINIALVFQQQKNYKKALELYNEALGIYLKNNYKFDIALAYNNIGSVYYDMHDLEKSVRFHKKSLAIKEGIGDVQGVVMSLQNLGLIYKDWNKLDSALAYLNQGKKILDSLPDPASEMELCNTTGSVYLRMKDTKNAALYLNRALAIHNSGINYYKIYQVYENLSQMYAMEGNYKDAYYYSRRYWSMLDSIQNNENAKIVQQKELEAVYESKKREDKLKQELEKKAEEKQQRIWNIFYICIFSALVIVIVVIYRNYSEKKKANGLLSERNNIISSQNVEIRKQSELLEEKNRDITDSIQYAKRLQDAILPTDSEMNSIMQDYFVLYKPKDIVSGDFYWMHDLSSDHVRKYLFAVVDCTGHGVPGGFVSIVGNNALNRAVNEFGLIRPDLILDKVSELVENSFESESTEIRDGMDIALISVSYEKENINLEYAGANNPLWLIRDEDVEEIKADKQPIGKYEARKPFTLHSMKLKKNDRIYLFSDGYADQFGGAAGKKFKYAQLKERLVSLRSTSMTFQKNDLDKVILNWKGELEQIDDICVAGINL